MVGTRALVTEGRVPRSHASGKAHRAPPFLDDGKGTTLSPASLRASSSVASITPGEGANVARRLCRRDRQWIDRELYDPHPGQLLHVLGRHRLSGGADPTALSLLLK